MAHVFASDRPAGRRAGPAAPRRAAPGGALDALRQAAETSNATRDLAQLQAMAGTIQRQIVEEEEELRMKARGTSGLPAQLPTGVEGLSGPDMGSVRVHHDSARPAAVGVHAFAQGTDIHLGPARRCRPNGCPACGSARSRVRPRSNS